MAAPILLCDTAGMSNDRWLECRMHGPKGDIPYTIGGSDVAAIKTAIEEAQKAFYPVAEKLYSQANPQGDAGCAGDCGNCDDNVVDADYKEV